MTMTLTEIIDFRADARSIFCIRIHRTEFTILYK